jgi:hypothetical protein
MTARGTALVLAILLLAAGASAAPDACCFPSGRADQAIGSMDCCATMLECPAAPQAALTTTVKGVETLQAHHALPADSALFPLSFPRLITARASLGMPADGPPLFRLHAQLLI